MITALITTNIIGQPHAFMTFGNTLIIFTIETIRWWEDTFANVEGAVSILKVLVESIMAHHMV